MHISMHIVAMKGWKDVGCSLLSDPFHIVANCSGQNILHFCFYAVGSCIYLLIRFFLLLVDELLAGWLAGWPHRFAARIFSCKFIRSFFGRLCFDCYKFMNNKLLLWKRMSIQLKALMTIPLLRASVDGERGRQSEREDTFTHPCISSRRRRRLRRFRFARPLHSRIVQMMIGIWE